MNELQERVNQFDRVLRGICTELNITYAGVDLDEGEIIDAIKKLKKANPTTP